MSARKFDLNRDGKYGNVTVVTVQTVSAETHLDVWLHNTVVLSHNKGKNTVMLNTGGWYTKVTTTAINNALKQLPDFEHIHIKSEKGVWLIGSSGGGYWTYQDGITFKSSNGKVEKA